MAKKKFQNMLREVARREGISVRQAYKLMQEAIDAGQQNPNPIIQARWQMIPHKGERVTVEEFFDYCERIGPYGRLPFGGGGNGLSS